MAIIDEIQRIIECREEGKKLYIMVYPQTDKTVAMNAFYNIYKNVLNGDLDLVKRVIDKASGQWECIGDTPLVYDEELNKLIEVKANPMSAYMKITLPASKKDLTVNHLVHRLGKAGVVFGINMEILKEVIEKNFWEQDIPVASGVEPTLGYDGGMEMKVNLAESIHPKKLEDGSVDYREIMAFTVVNKGDVIASQIPAKQGKPGKNVFGEEIPAKEQKEYELKPSNFISVTEDKRNLVADQTGVLINRGGVLSIKEHLELEDIDFNTGNVRFPGKIMINGNVAPGFTVESDSDIFIRGSVEAATIKSTNGSIQIKSGISGKNNTTISAKNEVEINFAQDANIECIDGLVTVYSYTRHCQIICKNFKTVSDRASIIGGKIEAIEEITVANCSNKDSVLTQLVIFDPVVKELTGKEIQLKTIMTQLEKVYVPLKKDYEGKRDRIKAFGYAPNTPQYAIYEAARQKFEGVKKKYDLVEGSINEINTILSKSVELNGSISICGDGYVGTHLQIGNHELILKNDVFGRKYFLKKGEIENCIIS